MVDRHIAMVTALSSDFPGALGRIDFVRHFFYTVFGGRVSAFNNENKENYLYKRRQLNQA